MKTPLRLAAALLLSAGLLSCKLFDYSNIVSKKFALVYGVTAYSMSGTSGDPNLTYPDQDASAVASLLSAQGYTVSSRWVDEAGEIYVNGINTGHTIGSPQYDASGSFSDPGYVTGDAPTRDTIISDITSLASSIGSNDLVLLYFSGHGTQDTSASPYREYFVPYEGVSYFHNATTPDFYADVSSTPPRCVMDNDLASAFAALRTNRKVLILDTCNSGGFIGNQLESDWTPSLSTSGPAFVSPGTLIEAISSYASMKASPTGLSPYGAQVLSAAGRDELSYETDSWRHGVMTYWLLQGLQGPGDLNNDGHITVLEAFSYAKAGIDKNWNSDSGVTSQGYTFEPHISGGPVDFVLF
jgi:hypothetical protein